MSSNSPRRSNERRGRNTHSRRSGPQRRNLNRAERQQILEIWYHINRDSRFELLNTLAEMSGFLLHESVEPRSQAVVPSQQSVREPPSASVNTPPRRTRVWEREILRDVPRFRAFGDLTSSARGQDTETARLLSIATGVVSRGRDQGISDEIILRELLRTQNDSAEMHGLFPRREEPVPNLQIEASAESNNEVRDPVVAPIPEGIPPLAGLELAVEIQPTVPSVEPAIRSGQSPRLGRSWASECETSPESTPVRPGGQRSVSFGPSNDGEAKSSTSGQKRKSSPSPQKEEKKKKKKDKRKD